MATRYLLLSAVVLSACIQLTYSQILAQLCYNRERELDCTMDSPLKKGALMNIGSITVALSQDENDLKTLNQDGQSCREIRHQCTVSMRPTNAHTFPQQLKNFYQLIEDSCVNKTTCDIVMPNWDFINLKVLEPGCPAVDGKTYHFKSTLLALNCHFPPPPPTTVATTTEIEFTEEAIGGDGVEVVVIDKEEIDTSDNSTATTTDEEVTELPVDKDGGEDGGEEGKESEESDDTYGDKNDNDIQPPPAPGRKRDPKRGPGSGGDHMTCSATIIVLSAALARLIGL